jgi:dihydrofolate reductase
VFSTTLKEVTWKNTLLFQNNVATEIAKLKEQPGKDLVVFGSPGFAKTLMQLNLIDEYRLTINPIILGDGKPLFPTSFDMTRLRLLEARTFTAGVVALHYQSVRNDV